MPSAVSRALLFVPLLLALLGAWACAAWLPAAEARVSALPPTVVWSWDRAEDLSFLPEGVAVALVTQSVELEGPVVRVRPRRTPLTLPATATVFPVVHVDALARWQPLMHDAQESRLVDIIVAEARRAARPAVQVDFEALPSQRDFYLRVLQRVRAQLPDAYLSMTALASWCLGDRWLQAAPVDEVVAMAFRMGPDAAQYRQSISQLDRWPESQCTSVGLASDEPPAAPASSQRVYLFSPEPWTLNHWERIRARYTLRPNNSNNTALR